MKKDRFSSTRFRLKAGQRTFRFWLWLITFIGVIVPRRLRANWRREWEAELRHREETLARWDQLDWRRKLDLLRRSTSAFWDALWLQPKRLEDEMFQDIRYGVRMMRKAPGFTAVATLALALGIGGNNSILSAGNGFFLRPLPVEKPAGLVASYLGRKIGTQILGDFFFSDYVDLREQNKSFSGLCAWTGASASIGSGESRNAGDSERAEVIWGELVSGNYFDVMGVKPALGRGFLPEEVRTPNTHPVTVISHSFWQQRFNG